MHLCDNGQMRRYSPDAPISHGGLVSRRLKHTGPSSRPFRRCVPSHSPLNMDYSTLTEIHGPGQGVPSAGIWTEQDPFYLKGTYSLRHDTVEYAQYATNL